MVLFNYECVYIFLILRALLVSVYVSHIVRCLSHQLPALNIADYYYYITHYVVLHHKVHK